MRTLYYHGMVMFSDSMEEITVFMCYRIYSDIFMPSVEEGFNWLGILVFQHFGQ